MQPSHEQKDLIRNFCQSIDPISGAGFQPKKTEVPPTPHITL